MAEQTLAAPDLAAINEKLDLLTARVEYLTEQAELAARRQAARDELFHDALPVANQALEIVTEQLEEVQECADLDNLLRLFKRLLRNGCNFDRLLDQLESLMDLAQTVAPLTNDVFEKATGLLESAEQKGYFTFVKGGAQVADGVVASLNEEDLKKLGDNAILVLGVLKDLTEPADAPSLLALLRQMRDPDARRGLAVILRALRAIGAKAAAK